MAQTTNGPGTNQHRTRPPVSRPSRRSSDARSTAASLASVPAVRVSALVDDLELMSLDGVRRSYTSPAGETEVLVDLSEGQYSVRVLVNGRRIESDLLPDAVAAQEAVVDALQPQEADSPIPQAEVDSFHALAQSVGFNRGSDYCHDLLLVGGGYEVVRGRVAASESDMSEGAFSSERTLNALTELAAELDSGKVGELTPSGRRLLALQMRCPVAADTVFASEDVDVV